MSPNDTYLPPLQFTSFMRPMVWGGVRLAELLGKPLSSDSLPGESWEVSDHPQHRSIIATGPLTGHSLRYLMEHRREALLGPAAATHATFPWLIKFLDANAWLSVQVHPDDATVKRLWPGEGGKTEAWFVLDAHPESRIYAGLKPGVDEKALRAALAAGTVAHCMHVFTPRPGDCVFLPAGTVHAVGGGVLLAEVQQTSDATFRLFDWNRVDAAGKPRTLHIDKGLAAIDWQRGPVTPTCAEEFTGLDKAGPPCRQPLVRCPYFQLDYLSSKDSFACAGAGRLQALIVLAGKGRLVYKGHEESLTAGQVWLLPASLASSRCVPEPTLSALLCALP
jgi:mannose-6-phosphate isomerase